MTLDLGFNLDLNLNLNLNLNLVIGLGSGIRHREKVVAGLRSSTHAIEIPSEFSGTGGGMRQSQYDGSR
jgi:hypothetical protein